MHRQIGQCTFNQDQPTSLRQIQPLPNSHTPFHFFLQMPLYREVDLYDAPKGRPKYFISTLHLKILAKFSTSTTSPTGKITDLDKLIFNPTPFRNIKREHKLLCCLTKDQSFINKQEMRHYNFFTILQPHQKT